MKKLNLLLSLITRDNDYQIEQERAAIEVGGRLGVDVHVIYADSDAIMQSRHLLDAIQAPAETRPDAIILEPAGGTALTRVAEAAVDAGIGWVIMDRECDYVASLRRKAKVVFGSLSDQLQSV
jgi:ribose transport system substrate-binding protein